ncbi:rab11 family-interacting protein 3 isoform X2 [Salminus brasiliensis]|uniref:rab11 family-interacting protein 3 isoform X2 n=1 Tax=Salminus brasiliensis TaxID=930266 RepID=UPI003B8340F1
MEQVLSSPRSHSDWESDQNSLGFLLLDMDNDVVTGNPEKAERHQRGEPGIVSLSFDEIFQENAFNLDDLFRASRYSGLEQTYPWEQSTECVSPWDEQPPHPQELPEKNCCDAMSGDVDTGDLISFSSTTPSPTHTSTSVQAARQYSPTQAMDLLQPIVVTDTGCPLDGFIRQAPLEPLLDQTLSPNLSLQRTTVIEEHLGSPSQVREATLDPSQSIAEQVGDLMCVDSENVLDLAAFFSAVEGSGRTAVCELEHSPTSLTPMPVFCPSSSSSPPCSYPDPPGGPTSLTLCIESHVQPCDRSCAPLLVTEATIAGMSTLRETNAPSASNIEIDSTPGIQATQSPVDLSESAAQSVHDKTGLGPVESIFPGLFTDCPVEKSQHDLRTGSLHEGDETLETKGEMENDLLSDLVPKTSLEQDLESVLSLDDLMASPDSVPEQTTPAESASPLQVSLFYESELTFDNSGEPDELSVNTHPPETSCHVSEDSDLSITCGPMPLMPSSGDSQEPEPLDSEKEAPADSFDALESQSDFDSSIASETRLTSVSPVVQTVLNISPEPAPETPGTVSPDSHCYRSTLPDDTENEQTINSCSEDILNDVHRLPHSPSLCTQEPPARLCQSDNASVDYTTQQYCNDLDGDTTKNEVPTIQKESENLSIGDHNCEHTHTQDAAPDECDAMLRQQNDTNGYAQSLPSEDHLICDDDNQNTHTLIDSRGENSVDTPVADSTTVPTEDLPSIATLPSPGSPRCEILHVQEEESEHRDNDQDQVTHSSESVPSPLDSTPLSAVDSQLTQVGVTMEQRRGVATPDSDDVRAEGETDLPVQCTQVDLPQVTDPLPNSSLTDSSPLADESPSEVCPPEEICTPLMEETIDVPDVPSHAEMALDLCVSSDAAQDGSVAADVVPVANVPTATPTPRDEEHSALQAVFQALDQDGDGFVRIEEFMEFATAYGAEQVKDLTRFLDPSGLGVISFEDFHRGITAISNGGSDPDFYRLQLSSADANGAAEEYDEQAEVSDSAYLGSESAYSECETFTDEDTGALVHPELHEDVETDSGIENTLTESEDRNRFSDLHGHALASVIGGEEEHFEDFGESNSDLLLANQEEGRAAPEGEGDPEPHPHPGSPMHRPQMLLSPSSSKRLSSKKAARHLLQSGGLDGMSDLSRDILDLADSDITDKVLLLERRVCELEKDSVASEEQHARLRQENLTLVHRANALEEQLKEQELRADENLQTLARRHRDTLSKLQRERDLEIENLQARLHQLDEENSELRSCVPCLRANIERLEEEKRKLQDEVEDVSDRLNEESESRRKMSDKLSHERHSNHKEKENTQELIEDLRKQLEHLQLFKLETEARRGRLPGAGLQEYNTHMRENELEQEIRRLKQDNRSLKEQNDELNGQIINLSIQGAKSLFTESLSESLASEINNVSRAELMEAIQKQEEINYRLQDYIDRIIVAIMESNPSILEVK